MNAPVAVLDQRLIHRRRADDVETYNGDVFAGSAGGQLEVEDLESNVVEPAL